jgi:hypothetical protein
LLKNFELFVFYAGSSVSGELIGWKTDVLDEIGGSANPLPPDVVPTGASASGLNSISSFLPILD